MIGKGFFDKRLANHLQDALKMEEEEEEVKGHKEAVRESSWASALGVVKYLTANLTVPLMDLQY